LSWYLKQIKNLTGREDVSLQPSQLNHVYTSPITLYVRTYVHMSVRACVCVRVCTHAYTSICTLPMMLLYFNSTDDLNVIRTP